MSENGKGDKQRPLSINKETFDNNWDRIFNKKKEETDCHYSGLLSVSAYENKENE